jgi:putative membrane protein
MFKGIVIRLLANSVAMLIVTHTIKGVDAVSTSTAIVAALVLGLVNAFIRPVIILITLPINILTLGLFTFIINGFLFYLVPFAVKGFSVAGFLPALIGSIVFSFISFLLSMLIIY